jgi:hypothetical protein
MADLVFLGLTAAFFAVCVAYVSLCDRILGPDGDVAAAPEQEGALR